PTRPAPSSPQPSVAGAGPTAGGAPGIWISSGSTFPGKSAGSASSAVTRASSATGTAPLGPPPPPAAPAGGGLLLAGGHRGRAPGPGCPHAGHGPGGGAHGGRRLADQRGAHLGG